MNNEAIQELKFFVILNLSALPVAARVVTISLF